MAKKTAAPTQLPLVPGQALSIIHARVPLAMIHVDRLGEEPNKAFIDSVKMLGGFLHPPVVRGLDGGNEDRYAVVAGRRRLRAAQLLEMTDVDVLVVPADFDPSLLSIIENNQRSANEASDLVALETLLGRGFSEGELASLTHLTATQIKGRLKLRNLQPVLRHAVLTGALPASVGLDVARLSPDIQKKCAKLFDENGKLTGKDVRELRSAAKAVTVNALDDGLFGEEDETEQEEETLFSWKEQYIAALDQAFSCLPLSCDEITVDALSDLHGQAKALVEAL